MTQLGNDSFVRANNASSWTTASDGQTWTKTGTGTVSIASNEGVIVSNGSDTSMQLGSKTSGDMEILCRIAIANTNDICGIQARFTAGGGTSSYKLLWYAGSLHINKAVAGTSSPLVSATMTMATSVFYWFRLRILGTSLLGKAWQSGTAEPTSWSLSTTDSSVSGAGGFATLANTDPSSTGVQFDSFYVVDYLNAESLVVTDSALFTRTTLFVDALQASDLIPNNLPMTFVDSLVVSDIGSLQRWGIDALQISDKAQFGVDTTPSFTESLVVTDSLFAYSVRSDRTSGLVDIDVIGNGFIPGLPGIYGNVFLQAMQSQFSQIYVSVYTTDGHTLLGYLSFADFYFLLLTPEGVLWLSDQSVNIDQVGGVAVTAAVPVIMYIGGVSASNFNPVPTQDIEQAGYIAGSGTPPTNTNSGTDTTYTFASQVSRVILQNNTAVNAYYAFDQTASAGSLLLTPGSTVVYPKKCTALHLYTATSQAINGSSAGNIVVLGAL